MTATRNIRRMLEGTVTSTKMAKTITVLVERTYKHPKYKKYIRVTQKVHAHDERGEARRGDRVEIRSCRPLSLTKRWLLVRVVERSTEVEAVDVTTGIVDVAVHIAVDTPVNIARAGAGGASSGGAS